MRKFTSFQCLLKLLPQNLIKEAVEIHETDEYYKTFKSWDHLVAMIYAHLNELRSLRDVEVSLDGKTRFCPVNSVKKSTLSDANKTRDANYFLWIAKKMMSILPRKARSDLDYVVRLLDSSPIQLKGFGFDSWTKTTRTLRCQGIKLHTEYDLQWGTPVEILMTMANKDDCSIGKTWCIEPKTIYVFDKGYYDYNWWWDIDQRGSFFVSRLKYNAAIEIIENCEVSEKGVLEDAIIRFKHRTPRGKKRNTYEANLRRVVVERENKKPLVIVTNLRNLSAKAIANLYKDRWGIELFFKWIKQNLKIKKFLGRSLNAVKIQIATALITYMLVFIFKHLVKKNFSLRQTLVWLRCHLHETDKIYGHMKVFDYVHLKDIFINKVSGKYL